jgi:MYXO-CTERM domain-containing protein
MNRRSIGWVTAGALMAGMAVAGTRSIPTDVRFSTFTGTNMTLPSGAAASASLTLVESRDPSGALPAIGNPVWHREPWVDGLQEDLVHFDLERWASTDSGREGADCWLDENFDGAALDLTSALIEDFAGHSFWVPQDPDDWDRNLGGGKTGQGTIKPGAVVPIPAAFQTTREIRFLTTASLGSGATYNLLVDFVSGTDETINIAIPVTGAAIVTPTPTLSVTASIVEVDSVTPHSQRDNNCPATPLDVYEVIVTIGGAAPNVQALTFGGGGAGANRLNGPFALALDADAAYDAVYTYTGQAESDDDVADAIRTVEGVPGWWFNLAWQATFPDEYSDIFVELQCGDGPLAGPITWGPVIPLPGPFTSGFGAGLHDQSDINGDGAVSFGLDACRGTFFRVYVDAISAFDQGPTLQSLVLTYDIDEDADNLTTAGLFNPVTGAAAPGGAPFQERIDCDDTTAGASARTLKYVDVDGDGYGTTPEYTCATSGYATQAGDCNDTALDGASYFPTNPALETPAIGKDFDCDGEIRCYTDADGDGKGAAEATFSGLTAGFSAGCDSPLVSGADAETGDCKDVGPGASTIFPGNPATELPTVGTDLNCDGLVSCYTDADNDDVGSTLDSAVSAGTLGGDIDCDAVALKSSTTGDCLDSDASFKPGSTAGAPGDGTDWDCNGTVTCYDDTDNDGDGDPTVGVVTITLTGPELRGGPTLCTSRGESSNNLDCRDTLATYNKNNPTLRTLGDDVIGSGQDYDCSGFVTCYNDLDRDTWGTTAKTVTVAGGAFSVNCADPTDQRAAQGGDCEDTPGVAPGVPDLGERYTPVDVAEVAGVEQDFDCDGKIACFLDDDDDTFGTTTTQQLTIAPLLSLDCDRTSAQNLTLTPPVSQATSSRSDDCDDADPLFKPVGAVEADGSGADYNCDQKIYCFSDDDRDGEGDGALVEFILGAKGDSQTCDQSGATPTSSNDDDCDDLDDDFKTSAIEAVGVPIDYNCDRDFLCWPDVDGDGFGDDDPLATPVLVEDTITAGDSGSCDNRSAGYANDDEDCDDAAAATFPGANEPTGTQIDRNCGGTVVCYADADNDGYGALVATVSQPVAAGGSATCTTFGGRTTSGDCDDTLTTYNPGVLTEAPGGIQFDFNCDGVVNCFRDDDEDGQGDATPGVFNPRTGLTLGQQYTCNRLEKRSANKNDCDDDDALFFTGAAEAIGAGTDNDCSASVTCYVDADDDSYGSIHTVVSPTAAGSRPGCDALGHAGNDDDCLDCFNWSVGTASCLDSVGQRLVAQGANPGGSQVEVLEGGLIDENCDNRVGCYPDTDLDGYGDEATVPANPATWVLSNPVNEPVINGVGTCLTSQGHSANDDDCHDVGDTGGKFYPGAQHLVSRVTYERIGAPSGPAGPTEIILSEIPGNAFDDNCDGNVLCFFDGDRDGYGLERALSTSALDFKGWNGTVQPTAGAAGTYDRLKGGAFTCAASRNEAPLRPGPVWDCNDSAPDVFPGAAEADGVGNDNNCDATVFCFIDSDGDGFGGSTSPFGTPGGQRGYLASVSGALCTTANGFADNGDDCHDNNQFAYPRSTGSPEDFELTGHSPEIGEDVVVPGVGSREVGPGPTQFDYCGDGSTSCYDKAFDDDCSGFYFCYEDEDGDGAGTDTVADVYPVGVGANPSLTCVVPTGPVAGRRAATGSDDLNDLARDCHPDDPTAFPGRPDEVAGNDLDDNCDDTLACYRDQDDDGWGTSALSFITWSGAPGPTTPGYLPGTDRFDCDAINDMASERGSFDCHDNYQFANPGVTTEVAGHTPAQGATVALPGVGTVTVGTAPGQYDLCGDGSTVCYGRAFDDDCDANQTVHCYQDADGDRVGGALVTNERGIIPGSFRPWNETGATITPYTVFTCDTTSADAFNLLRRSAIGGVQGEAAHDCNDGHSGVKPSTVLGAAGTEAAGHTPNPSASGSHPAAGGDNLAYDEDCNGEVLCFEDQDQDFYGTRTVVVDVTAGALRDRTPVGTTYKAYDCEYTPGAARTSFARRGGLRGQPGFDRTNYDCHDNNAAANPAPGRTELPGNWATPTDAGIVAFDEDCDGFFTCYRDRDADGEGTETFDVPRTAPVSGRLQMPNGSTVDDGYYLCELGVADLTWAPGVEQSPLTGTGGPPGSTSYDCHDTNPDARHGVALDPIGDSDNGFGDTTKSWDDDCDGFVQCYRNVDGDLYGTYAVTLTPSGLSSDSAGTIAKVVGQDYYDCDNALQQWAGRGGPSTPNFDCHDDSAAAYPAGPGTHYGLTLAEDPRDAYDNDCNQSIDCFEDRDNDRYGTRVVPKLPSFFAAVDSPNYNPSIGKTSAEAGMRLYLCGDEAAAGAGLAVTLVTRAAWGLDTDRVSSAGGARGTVFFDENEFDCHDDNPGAKPQGTVESIGGSTDPLSGLLKAFDEDCDGSFTCWRDRDNDDYGTAQAVAVDRTAYNGGNPNRQPGASLFDDGIYDCDLSPPGAGAPATLTYDIGGGETHLAATGGPLLATASVGNTTFDCHDTNSLANPGVPLEDGGDSLDSDGIETRSWDDNCDGIIDCYRDYDGDSFGTYVRALDHGVANNDNLGTIAKVGVNDWYECDNATQDWAGKGDPNFDEFDCHDDNPGAFPQVPLPGISAEVDGDAYDNDCDGSYNCFEDLDNDEWGTRLKPLVVNPATGIEAPYLPWDRSEASALAAGMYIYPCGEDAALAAGFSSIDPLLEAQLEVDRRAEKGGVPADVDYDCHDDWQDANPGVGGENAGDPWDNNCDDVITCFEDHDGDGFGFTTPTVSLSVFTLAAQHVGSSLPQAAFLFEDFPFTVARSASPNNVLPAYPVQAFVGLGDYLLDSVEIAARENAESRTWYDCRAVDEATASGGTGSLFLDCHDEDPEAYPGFLVASGQVALIRPETRRSVSGPFDDTCDGPVMCVAGSGTGVQVYDRGIDDRLTPEDECTVSFGGAWRCFEAQGLSYVPGQPSDPGETSGDALDNDCDGTVLCYEDVDRDDVGTMPVVDDGTTESNPLWFGDHYRCTDGPEAEFTGDCHDNIAAIKPPVNLSTATKGDDVSKAPYWSAASAPAATGYDDPACALPGQVVLCHSGVDDSVYDRYEAPNCLATVVAPTFRCYNETIGDSLDQDCDGAVACWYDGDGDTYGVNAVKLASPLTLEPVTSPVATADPGMYSCAEPGFLTAAIGGTDPATSDCNDASIYENPGGVEPTSSLFVGVAAEDRQRAYEAIGNDIDEDCDLVVQCWRDSDGDQVGAGMLDQTPPVDFESLTQGDLESTWDGDGHLQWFIVASPNRSCDNPGMSAIIGDCHDDNPAAFTGAFPGVFEENPGDNYDENCDGTWTCFEDLDGDGFGSGDWIEDGSVSGTADRTCTTAEGEANDSDDCLDDNTRTATALFPQGQRYPISPTGTLDPTLPFASQPTIAFLSKPGGIEIYGDGYDQDCDNAELCFIDNDDDNYVDGTPQAGRQRDPLGRIGRLVEQSTPSPAGSRGVYQCQGTIVTDDGPRGISPWPLVGAIVVSSDPLIDPFVNPSTGKALFDCNDDDDAINPDAAELFYDGVDQNCDALSDYDRDRDGYDDRTATAEREPCALTGDSRYIIDPVKGCGIGTDCDDSAIGANIHPAPYVRTVVEPTALAQDYFELDNEPTSGPVTRYPPYDPANPTQLQFRGIQGEKESCEAGSQVDNDCDGNPNTYWECWYDIWEVQDQLLDFWDLAADGQRARGALSREYFTGCAQPYNSGLYFIDRADPLDYTPLALEDPATLAEATELYEDFIWDPTWTPPPNSSGSRYYRDDDGDTEGDLYHQGVRLCDVAFEDTIDVDWLTSHTDCNDDNPAINEQGLELCDRVDNNCNNLIDEQTLELTPDISSNCEWHYADSDEDSWGIDEEDVLEGTTDRYCLCPLFEATEVQEDGSIIDIEPPQVCSHWDLDGAEPVRLFGHRIAGVCYVKNDLDCDDLNFNIKPFEPNEEPYELIDGVDNDCNDQLPLIELDCDDDNAYPYLPLMSQALLDSQSDEPVISAESVGLQPCSGAPPDVTCWGDSLPVSCDTTTGLWVVPVQVLEEAGRFSGASRVARSSECAAWDCDDQCPQRCAGLDEECDGIDNDCDVYAEEALARYQTRSSETPFEGELIIDDRDGVPDAMAKDFTPLGKVQPGELDLDGDLHVSCAAGSQGRDNQTATTDKACTDYEQFLDCNDLCVLSAPAGPEEEVCNGFVEPDLCVDPGESDADGDDYRSCGTFGPDPAASEKIYMLMYSEGNIDAFLEEEGRVPLGEVVPLVPPRRYAGAAFEKTDREGDVRECDAELNDRLETLVGGELSEDDAAARDELLAVCVRVETCRVLRERIEAGSGLSQSSDNDDDVIDRPAPAAPPTGVAVLPAYCDGLEDARCSVVELTLGNDRDADLYTQADAWRVDLKEQLDSNPAIDSAAELAERATRGCVFDADYEGECAEGDTACAKRLYHPEQAVTRTVWSKDQIVAARKLTVEYECFRMFGTFGCDPDLGEEGIPGDASWQSPFEGVRTRSEGYFRLPDVPISVVDHYKEWWIYLNRFKPQTVDGGGTLVGCWGDPRANDGFVDAAETIQQVGGDCQSDGGEKDKLDPTTANRGMPEGPGDLVAAFDGISVDCSTCLDEMDNNCDGLVDQEDPACARCFVGQGYGCGCSAGPNVSTLGRTSTTVMALAGLLAAFARRRKRT